MKTGASDPFGDDGGNEISESESTDSETTTEETTESVTPDNNTSQINRADLPLILRRDTVKDERESVHQLFVQDSTDGRAKDAERELESIIGDDIYRLDAREAIYLAGMRNLDTAADILREWGYDL
ncbi:hypothetical protein BG842_24070 [Haladaptatus sp. W1]|uniref:hypothetical protein n=1 Tax=Haladaptatus sp. W1 TaxID=1897478 RepID=UPI0008498DDD|nr:hypothetical protein [Haladaptatus sp. W1]ODR81943.1 hypothetical protein BG842_24070 [Haladaptatus sp. W1]